MKNFNDPELLKKIDPQETVKTTEMMPKQCLAAWDQVMALSLPRDLGKEITNIVFCGMGASIYGALVIKALQGAEMPYPSETISDYHLPAYVDNHTLVVLTSYSGSTEEVLSCAEEAKTKGAKMLVLTKGGKLSEFAKENKIPSYIFDGKLNLSSTPRLGAGYTILGLIGLLSITDIITVEEGEIENALKRLTEKIPDLKKQAMKDSEIFTKNIPVVFAAEHLSGNGQILRNQFNETSKTFSSFFLVPDLNHHLMEGLQFPTDAKIHFLVVNSRNYSPTIQKRMALTVDVVKQNKRPITEFVTSGQTVYDDFLETLIYGSYLTLYLGLLHDQNPAINPWVDYFKEQLTK